MFAIERLNKIKELLYKEKCVDLGYLAGYAAAALVDESITGAVGDTFDAGDLGEFSCE